MTHTQHDTQFAQLVQRIAPQGKLLRRWELKGGLSAEMMALEVEGADGEVRKMIVRRRRWHDDETMEWRRQRAANEFRVLQLVRSRGVTVPTPYYMDLSCDMLPTPYLLLEYIEGQPNFAPTNVTDMAAQIARQLANIHRIGGSTVDLSFLPQSKETFSERFGEQMSRADVSAEEWRIAETLQAVWPTLQRNPSTLLHGDFWPGNMLWRDGQLVAVIDWEDAKLGNPLEDVAITRFDLLFIYGLDAMNEFTRTYQAISPIDMSHLPYWDLYAALRAAPGLAEWAVGWPELGREDITEERIREAHGWFVGQAFEKLGNGERGTGNRESGIGNRESGIGNRGTEIGEREWGTHELTNSRTHELTNSRTHELTNSRTHELTNSRTHERGLDYLARKGE